MARQEFERIRDRFIADRLAKGEEAPPPLLELEAFDETETNEFFDPLNNEA